MIVTPDMHERKRLMFERSDAFVALPGGIGTLEELVEQLTWQQLGRHAKPILLANIDGFWEPLLDAVRRICAQRSSSGRLWRSKSSRRSGSRISCRGCEPLRARASDASKELSARSGAAAVVVMAGLVPAMTISNARHAWTSRWKRHRLDPVAVGIDNERRVVTHAIMRAQTRRAVGSRLRHSAPRRGMHRPRRSIWREGRYGRTASLRCTAAMPARRLIQNSG